MRGSRIGCLLVAVMTAGVAAGAEPPHAAPATTQASVSLPAWEERPGDAQPIEIGRGKAVIYGGGVQSARFYPAELLPAVFERTLQIEPGDLKDRGVDWIFTGPEGGFTLRVSASGVRLTQRYYNSYGFNDVSGHAIKAARHPERRWLEDSVLFAGELRAVTVAMGANLDVAVRLNGLEVLRQPCLLDVYQQQLSLTGEGPLRATLFSPATRELTIRIDPQRRFQTMLGFGGIGSPMAYAMLGPEGKRRWWELIAEYNLLIQREYPIGTRLNPAMDNWDRRADATAHYYADNFPNGEVSDFDYIRTIRKLGGMVWFEFWALPPWTVKAGERATTKAAEHNAPVDLAAYARAVVGYCQTSRERVGVPPEVVGIQNEVGHPPEEYCQMTLALRRALDEAGFSAVKIHLSDDGELRGGIERAKAVRASEQAWAATDYVASHVYDYQRHLENLDAFDATISQWNAVAAGKSFLSTEICVNNPKYQVPSYRLALSLGALYHKNLALMNAQAICYCWTILNVVQPSFGWTRSLFVPDVARGGMPAASSNQLRVFGAFSRRIRRGMTRIAAEGGDDGLLVTAYQGSAGTTVILLNRSASPCRVNLAGLDGLTEMELCDGYHENAVSPASRGPVRVLPGAIVTLSNVPLGLVPVGFEIAGGAK